MQRMNRQRALEATQDFQPVPRKGNLKKYAAITMMAACFTAGIVACKLWWPSYNTVEVEKKILVPAPKTERETKPHDRNNEYEIRWRADAKVIDLFKTSWSGVLVVKDNEAQTVLHKRAALGNKDGFINLENGSYPVHNYFLHIDTGYGIVDDGKRNFFLLVWCPGKTKAPIINPGTIRVPTGRRVEPGSP